MSWWTCHRGRLCPSAAVGGAISRYLTRICVHIRHMHINEIVITFIIVVIIRTMMMIMMIIANLWIIMNMYLYMCVCIYEYVCVYSICVCVLSWFFTRTHMHIYPSVHASIRKLNLPAPTLLTLLSRCVLAAKEAAYQTSWPPGQHRMNGLGYVGIPPNCHQPKWCLFLGAWYWYGDVLR